MGFNPDDFEYAPLGRLHSIGPGSIDHVTVRGGHISELTDRFMKASMDYNGEWAEHAGFGMGPRRWTLLGPVERDHQFSISELQALAPVPAQQGWSQIVRFGDDRIDLDRYFDDPTHCAVYAFTRFTMARSDSVRLWVSSDEDLEVWIDSESVHAYKGRRKHVLGGVREHRFIEVGGHTLLVRAGQRRGCFDFSINICEPIDDPLFAGNRYSGVRFYATEPGLQEIASTQIKPDHVREEWIDAAYVGRATRHRPRRRLANSGGYDRHRRTPQTPVVDAARCGRCRCRWPVRSARLGHVGHVPHGVHGGLSPGIDIP